MWQVLHNGTDGPVVIDAEGRQLGAGEWGVADTTDEVAKAADDRGDATFVPDSALAGRINPEAQAAKDEAAARNKRSEELRDVDKDRLAQAAADAGLGLGEDPDKPTLVRALAAGGLEPAAEDAPEPEPQTAGEPAGDKPPPRRGSRAGGNDETVEV